MSPLIRLGANVTPKDVYSTVAGLHAAGFPTDEFVGDMADYDAGAGARGRR